MFRGSNYIKEAFDLKTVKKIVKSFGQCISDNIFGDFDGLVCRGTSGLLIAPLLAYEYDLKLLVVRKPKDNSHAYDNILEGADDIRRFVIIDDFVSSGRTLEEILKGIKEGTKQWRYEMYQPIYVGCYFWCGLRRELYAKEKIYSIDRSRFYETAYQRVFVQRDNEKYKCDAMDEEKYLRNVADDAA